MSTKSSIRIMIVMIRKLIPLISVTPFRPVFDQRLFYPPNEPIARELLALDLVLVEDPSLRRITILTILALS